MTTLTNTSAAALERRQVGQRIRVTVPPEEGHYPVAHEIVIEGVVRKLAFHYGGAVTVEFDRDGFGVFLRPDDEVTIYAD